MYASHLVELLASSGPEPLDVVRVFGQDTSTPADARMRHTAPVGIR